MENIYYLNDLLMENEGLHEGQLLKNFIKGSGYQMKEVAEKLQMTRQNLSYHLRKKNLDDDFRRLFAEKFKIDFAEVKSRLQILLSTPDSVKNDSSMNVPLKKGMHDLNWADVVNTALEEAKKEMDELNFYPLKVLIKRIQAAHKNIRIKLENIKNESDIQEYITYQEKEMLNAVEKASEDVIDIIEKAEYTLLGISQRLKIPIEELEKFIESNGIEESRIIGDITHYRLSDFTQKAFQSKK